MSNSWAILKNVTFKSKVLWLLFGQLLENWRRFIPTSGHTGSEQSASKIHNDVSFITLPLFTPNFNANVLFFNK